MYFVQETNGGTISYDKLAQQFCGTEFRYPPYSMGNNLLVYQSSVLEIMKRYQGVIS